MNSMKLQEENETPKEQLALASKETLNARSELQHTQENMQREFASLWMAVQELNKLDAVKEQALADLVSDRDRTVRDRDMANKKLHELTVNYQSLHRELQVGNSS